MQRFLKIVGVVAVIAVLVGVGYVVGVAHAVRVMCAAEAQAAKAQTRELGVPYPGTICENCRANYPDWWCWLGGCP